MWGRDTAASKDDIGSDFPSISAAEILRGTADAFPVAAQFPIGESLTQVTLSPLEAADLLFYLTHAMSMLSVATAIGKTQITLKGIDEDLIFDMDPAQRTSLKSAIETATSRGRQPKNGHRANTKRK
jgi:hypothetical protein